MSLTAKQAFKAAFVNDCLDQGMTIEEIVKTAHELRRKIALTELISKPFTAGVDVVTDLAKRLGGTALTTGMLGALAGPPIVGAGLGYGAAKLTDWDDVDTAEAKKRELIDQYNRFAMQARLNREARRRREQREPSFSRI